MSDKEKLAALSEKLGRIREECERAHWAMIAEALKENAAKREAAKKDER